MINLKLYLESERNLGEAIREGISEFYPDAIVHDLHFGKKIYGCIVTEGKFEGRIKMKGKYDPENLKEHLHEDIGKLLVSCEPSSAMGFLGKIGVYKDNPKLFKICEQIAKQVNEDMKVVTYF